MEKAAWALGGVPGLRCVSVDLRDNDVDGGRFPGAYEAGKENRTQVRTESLTAVHRAVRHSDKSR